MSTDNPGAEPDGLGGRESSDKSHQQGTTLIPRVTV